MPDNKSFYRSHLWKDAPIFHQPFWLDAVAGNSWDAAIVEEKDKLKAYYIYAFRKDATGLQIVMPKLTQFLGPNYELNSQRTRERNNETTKLLEQLAEQLPPFAYFESRWHFNHQNWLPFYWNGFEQTTRYTYVLENIQDTAALRAQFSDKINREINKAEKNFVIEKSSAVNLFYRLLEQTFTNNDAAISFSLPYLEGIYNACKENQAGEIWLSKDKSGKVAAGIFIVWDSTTAYYLIGGKDESFGNSGAMSHLFWHVLNTLKDRVNRFDFEGSMIKGVENYFRSFGAEQRGYFELSKISSAIHKTKAALRKYFKR